MQEENKRRRDECIQLRAILAQQSQSLRTLGSTSVRNDLERFHDDGELIEAFQAQKLVNRSVDLDFQFSIFDLIFNNLFKIGNLKLN